MEQLSVCPKCSLQVLPAFYFCPNCGKSLRPKPLSISVGKQIGLYALSLLLPPLGLWPGIKYVLQDNPKAKIVGGIAILLTVISLGGTIYYMSIFMKEYTSQFSNQLNIPSNSQLQ